MKYFLAFLFCCRCWVVTAQQFSPECGVGGYLQASGSISIPLLQSLSVDNLYPEAVQFSNSTNYNQGLRYSSFFKVTVVSSGAWVVSVRAAGALFHSVGGSPDMPVNVMRLKRNTSGMIQLSDQSQSLCTSTSNAIKTEMLIDTEFNPGWNYKPGAYSTTLIFTLTAQ